MPHRFTLAAVLKLRESIEERDLHLLEQTQVEIARATRLLKAIRNRKLLEVSMRECELAQGTSGAHLHIIEGVKGRTLEVQQSLEKLLAALQHRREQQLADYVSSKRKRETLSELRDRQNEAHELRVARERQRVIDDLFLARQRQK